MLVVGIPATALQPLTTDLFHDQVLTPDAPDYELNNESPINRSCYGNPSLNTYLVRFGCPLLTKLVGYLTGGPIRLELLPYVLVISAVWRTSEPDQKLAAQSPPLLQAGTGASFLYLSTPTHLRYFDSLQSLDHQLRDERHQRNPRDRMVCEKHLARECSSAISVSYSCTKRCSPSRRSI